MKRQRKRPQGPTKPAAEKRCKRPAAAAAEGMMETEQRENPAEAADAMAAAAAAAAAVAVVEEEEWWGLRLKDGDVDEQMSWGTVWLPFWDVDFVGRNYGALFNDVLWDDDIWNLKTVMEVPNAP